ncbi:MAG: glycosyltransferase family 2 protein [Candidatus Brocadia sp. AMX2]|uniref:Glycosyltransferases n=1 Tax=Candidatus Brocadia sinica JPN1 TaxID=1197129 RepID=A0ABQ0JV34_9BACT|nr:MULTISPECIES: glycosyltransferase family 2 protein [Brocadia]KXK32821.1 MAG: putative glycosyl transferase [Candidatus Brocadia sinica]MBC6930923.1 glycosyltransferase family 2 protein [Candidatus Brocadia sp.]MBL1167913.1 glycosyltransferase family 2 protein [Candidatus Brocadia sp. AMX1]NOG41527.1 glycosyltransferase family 2 protein [Planctomycetota bacterium]KAA0245366.1 MAG: glycosyltransferase family 2 protein [Candidatus Brocadia sp. AMX2]
MKVSVILVNYNSAVLLRQCLKSIYEQTKEISFEIIVVDNASSDNSRQVVRSEFPTAQLIESSGNLGFSRGNNLGASLAKGTYLLFLNTDTILFENSIKVLAGFLDTYPEVGAVGPKILFEDRYFQLSAGRLPNLLGEFFDKIIYSLARRWHTVMCPLLERRFNKTKAVGWLTGACFMVRQKAFVQVNGFDEKIFMYFEDKDLCKRISLSGWQIMYYPLTSIVHLLAGSSGTVDKQKINEFYRTSQIYYYHKHLGWLQSEILRLYLRATGKLQCL